MKDGSDAVSDWPLLNALLNTASGDSWVSLHHGGGVGMGYLAALRRRHRGRRHARSRRSVWNASCGTTRPPASCATPTRAMTIAIDCRPKEKGLHLPMIEPEFFRGIPMRNLIIKPSAKFLCSMLPQQSAQVIHVPDRARSCSLPSHRPISRRARPLSPPSSIEEAANPFTASTPASALLAKVQHPAASDLRKICRSNIVLIACMQVSADSWMDDIVTRMIMLLKINAACRKGYSGVRRDIARFPDHAGITMTVYPCPFPSKGSVGASG